MCPRRGCPREPVYGSNDWYWAYGKNSAESVRTDAGHIVELSPAGAQPAVRGDRRRLAAGARGRTSRAPGCGTAATRSSPTWRDSPPTSARSGARPGIWIRPLQAPADAPDGWRLPRDRTVLDPTVPEVREKVAADVARLRRWGFDLIKHDYSHLGHLRPLGFPDGGRAHQRRLDLRGRVRAGRRAEVINELYGAIREAAGDALVIGCNTVSHLSAGLFEMCRIGDDTSGTEWGAHPEDGRQRAGVPRRRSTAPSTWPIPTASG